MPQLTPSEIILLRSMGEVIPDDALLGMNYYVEGVDGKLPK